MFRRLPLLLFALAFVPAAHAQYAYGPGAFRESSEPPSPLLSWDEALQVFAPLRKVVERLDEDEVAALRAEVEEIDRRYAEKPASYHVVLGRRR